ncbi:MAG: hypothetical protein J0H89_10980 [Rhizobiales bacterium]|nr:hypothetical protein [Hyphomicrobiales bacterium]
MQRASEIVMQINGTECALRPSLRAASNLERAYGFDRLLIDVSQGNIGTMADIVRHANGADLFRLIAGVDPDNITPAADTGERMTFQDYHAKLYRIATGWLGWTPETAWNATPTEIIEAYKGHLERLRAIHGGADSDTITDTPDKAALDRDGLGALRAMQGGF